MATLNEFRNAIRVTTDLSRRERQLRLAGRTSEAAKIQREIDRICKSVDGERR